MIKMTTLHCVFSPWTWAMLTAVIAFTGRFDCHVGANELADPPAVDQRVRGPQLLHPGDPHQHGLTDADLDSLRTLLRKAVDDRIVPGVSLLLAHKGEVIFKEAFGDLSVDQKAVMASSSKPVTATVVMILVDQGKLALDDPIDKYLPEFKGITIKGKPPAKLPTVRHVLCNMSGLPGDFLAESMLKRFRKGAGKAKNDVKGKRDRKGNLEHTLPLRAPTALWLIRFASWRKEASRPSLAPSFITAPWASMWPPGLLKSRPSSRLRN